MQILLDNITVIIRSADERTIELTRRLVCKEVCEENIFSIEEKPFSKAVKKTFEIGRQNRREWTLAVDADLYLLPGSIREMINNAKPYSTQLYMYQGRILDKFRGGIRYGGPHLYLTQNLFLAEEFYEEMKDDLRPETFINKKMELLGYKVITDKKLYALHDFHQFYKDIYRKSFFHGIKHHRWSSLLPIWLEKSQTDPDFRIAVMGFIDGYYDENKIYPSIEFLDNLFQSKFDNDLLEKEELTFPIKIDFERILSEHHIQITTNYDYVQNDHKRNKKKHKFFLSRIIKILKNKWGLQIGFKRSRRR